MSKFQTQMIRKQSYQSKTRPLETLYFFKIFETDLQNPVWKRLDFCVFFFFFLVGICLLKTVLEKFFSLFMMTFNKSYAIVVRLKQGIEIGRKKKNWSQTRRVKMGQKNSHRLFE